MTIEKTKMRKLVFSKPWKIGISCKNEKCVDVKFFGDYWARYFFNKKDKINRILVKNTCHNGGWWFKYKPCITEKEAKKIIRKMLKRF